MAALADVLHVIRRCLPHKASGSTGFLSITFDIAQSICFGGAKRRLVMGEIKSKSKISMITSFHFGMRPIQLVKMPKHLRPDKSLTGYKKPITNYIKKRNKKIPHEYNP